MKKRSSGIERETPPTMLPARMGISTYWCTCIRTPFPEDVGQLFAKLRCGFSDADVQALPFKNLSGDTLTGEPCFSQKLLLLNNRQNTISAGCKVPNPNLSDTCLSMIPIWNASAFALSSKVATWMDFRMPPLSFRNSRTIMASNDGPLSLRMVDPAIP
jgi:hypothetical protein